MATSAASANDPTTTHPPFTPNDAAAASARSVGNATICFDSSTSTAAANVAEVVTSNVQLSVPCSASISRSAAKRTGSAVSSAITRLSVGPNAICVEVP